MKNDLVIKNGILIPGSELEITTSRAGGPGGQHVNRTSTRITVRWNVKKTNAINAEQKELLLKNLEGHLTKEGDLIIHSGFSRSQEQNRKMAFKQLKLKIIKGLYIPKKRLKTHISEIIKQERLQKKKRRSFIKRMRKKNILES